MANNRTILVTLVLILIAALVTLNFEKFTGQTTKIEMTELYVSSKGGVVSETNPVISKGDSIYFTEVPGTKGGSGTLYIREIEGGRKWGKIVRTQVFDYCNSNKCNPGFTGTLKFQPYYNWEGKYCGEVKDLATWKKVITCFTVK